jgi:predicted nucleotide-binding protein (sugar kinase/HSP70/actin superfamily)
MDLVQNKHVSKIFYPCIAYNIQEDEKAGNHYNCPVVVSYPESIEANINLKEVKFYKPFLNLNDKEKVTKKLYKELSDENLSLNEIKAAVDKAYEVFYRAKTYAQILQTPYIVLETPSSYTINKETSDFLAALNLKGLNRRSLLFGILA